MQRRFTDTINSSAFIFLFALFLLSSCASPQKESEFIAGEPKNSLPFIEKNRLGAVHSIALPPFYGDLQGWKDMAAGILESFSRVAVISLSESSSIGRDSLQALSIMEPGTRAGILVDIGRTLEVDAVLNGILLRNDGGHEIILQLLTSQDSKILWWQAVEFRYEEGVPSPSDQRALLSSMLSPLLPYLAKKQQRPLLPPAIEKKIEPESQPEIDPVQKLPPKPKSSGKPAPEPEQLPADISPM